MVVPRLIVGILLIFLQDCVTVEKKIPDYVSICKRNDPSLNECYRNSFNAMIPKIAKGIPQMNLPPIEPMKIDKVIFDHSHGGPTVSFYGEMRDAVVHGLSNVHLDHVHVDLERMEWWINVSVPILSVDGSYFAKGKVLLLEFNANGSINGNVSDIKLGGVWYARKTMVNGKEHGEFYDFKMQVSFEKVQLFFSNMFPDKTINDAINTAINNNTQLFYEKLYPTIDSVFGQGMTQIVNRVYSWFPLKELYPED